MPDRYEDELRFRQQYQGACEDLANGVPLAQAYLNTGVETTTSSDIQRELDDRMARLRAFNAAFAANTVRIDQAVDEFSKTIPDGI